MGLVAASEYFHEAVKASPKGHQSDQIKPKGLKDDFLAGDIGGETGDFDFEGAERKPGNAVVTGMGDDGWPDGFGAEIEPSQKEAGGKGAEDLISIDVKKGKKQRRDKDGAPFWVSEQKASEHDAPEEKFLEDGGQYHERDQSQ